MRRSNPLFHAHTVRPALPDPLDHPEVLPYLPATNPAIGPVGSVVTRFVGRWLRGIHSPTEPMGRFLAEMAMGVFDERMEGEVGRGIERLEGGFMVLENSAVRRMGGMD